MAKSPVLKRKKFISVLLIAYRSECSLIQKDLADLLGVSSVSISNYEAGICFPRKLVIEKIARLLDTTSEELFNKPASEYFTFKKPYVKPSIDLKKATLNQIFEELKERNVITTLTLSEKYVE